MLDDMNIHYWQWPQHDVGNESEWSQSMNTSRIKARRAFEKRKNTAKMADKKAMEILATEGNGMEDNWIWKLSEINTVAEYFRNYGNASNWIRTSAKDPEAQMKGTDHDVVRTIVAEKPKLEKRKAMMDDIDIKTIEATDGAEVDDTLGKLNDLV